MDIDLYSYVLTIKCEYRNPEVDNANYNIRYFLSQF